MFDKILLAVDGSPPSEAAVEAAIGLAIKIGAEVEVVHVREHEISKWGATPDLETGGDAATLVDNVTRRLTGAGVAAHATVRQTSHDIASEIINVADEVGTEMIVIGTRGHSALSGMMLGSTSNRLVHLSGRPVLVVHTARREVVS